MTRTLCNMRLSAVVFLLAATFTAGAQTSDYVPLLEWPRIFNGDFGEVAVYQPQIDDWPDFAQLKARSAVVVTPAGETEPQYGMIELTARTVVDNDDREVLLDQIAIPDVLFPGADDAAASRALLGEALEALQSDSNIPQDVLSVAENIAAAIGALFEAEQASSDVDGKASIRHAMGSLSQTMALLQEVRSEHSGIQVATAKLAEVMSKLYPLSTAPTMAPGRPSSVPPPASVPPAASVPSVAPEK